MLPRGTCHRSARRSRIRRCTGWTTARRRRSTEPRSGSRRPGRAPNRASPALPSRTRGRVSEHRAPSIRGFAAARCRPRTTPRFDIRVEGRPRSHKVHAPLATTPGRPRLVHPCPGRRCALAPPCRSSSRLRGLRLKPRRRRLSRPPRVRRSGRDLNRLSAGQAHADPAQHHAGPWVPILQPATGRG
jgi:hypothetical protein